MSSSLKRSSEPLPYGDRKVFPKEQNYVGMKFVKSAPKFFSLNGMAPSVEKPTKDKI